MIIALAACVPVCVPGGSESATEDSESDTEGSSETATDESETTTDESETATDESETATDESETATHESESDTEGSSETAESETYETTYIEDLVFEETEIQVSMSDGIYQPSFSVLPEDAIDKKIAWSVSDEELASVDEEGCVVLLAPGDVTLTATLHSGKTISCLIHIGEAEEEEEQWNE